MLQFDLKAKLYVLTDELNRLKSKRKDLLEKHVITMPSEIQIQINELNKLIETKESDISQIL
jgi:hypothetical protein